MNKVTNKYTIDNLNKQINIQINEFKHVQKLQIEQKKNKKCGKILKYSLDRKKLKDK